MEIQWQRNPYMTREGVGVLHPSTIQTSNKVAKVWKMFDQSSQKSTRQAAHESRLMWGLHQRGRTLKENLSQRKI